MRVRQSPECRPAFTLVELLVVIAIILALTALAAAFMPRASESQNLSRAVDQLEQWLLTAKMRAKRDGLATGIRFTQAQNDATGTYSQCQYIQQPDPLSGGAATGNGTFNGGYCLTVAGTTVTFGNVDFSLGGLSPLDLNGRPQWLVQTGDYLELRNGGGIHPIASVTNDTTLVVSALQPIVLAAPTANYRILRQPRILIGENPQMLPNNFAVVTTLIPDAIVPNNSTATIPIFWSNVQNGFSGFPEILFSPTGAVVGSNVIYGKVLLSVYDTTMNPFDISRVGIIAIQSRTGYIGAYGAANGAGLMGYDPFHLAEIGRASGL